MLCTCVLIYYVTDCLFVEVNVLAFFIQRETINQVLIVKFGLVLTINNRRFHD